MAKLLDFYLSLLYNYLAFLCGWVWRFNYTSKQADAQYLSVKNIRFFLLLGYLNEIFFAANAFVATNANLGEVFANAKVKLLCSEVRAIARVKLSLPTLPKAKLHYPQDNFTYKVNFTYP